MLPLMLGFACRPGTSLRGPRSGDTTDVARVLPFQEDSSDKALATPRVVHDAAVVVFWLRAADTLPESDRADAFGDLRYYTAQIAAVLAANEIALVATRADTVIVDVPDHRRRVIVLSGLDYPFGYVFVDPGGPERILTGVYADDDLLDEVRAYFDLSDDSTAAPPRATT